MSMIRLQSSDGQIFDLDCELAMRSGTFKTMIDTLGMEEDEEPVPLPINSNIMGKIIKWLSYHKDDPPQPEDDRRYEKRSDNICSWDTNFFKVDQLILFQLMEAANYLEIKELLQTLSKTVANMIKGKTAEDIRKTFCIENDFTSAEQVQIQEEHKWFKGT